MPHIRQGCSFPLLEDFSLVQMVSEPTGLCNTVFLFLTNNDSLVNTVSILPGQWYIWPWYCLSHGNLKPVVQKQVPLVMPLYREADWIGFKVYAKEKCEGLMKDHPSKTVEELWSAFKTVIHNGIRLLNLYRKSPLVQRKDSRSLLSQSKDSSGKETPFTISKSQPINTSF